MSLLNKIPLCLLGLTLLPYSSVQALEPGSLNPAVPDYQLPKLPDWHPKETLDVVPKNLTESTPDQTYGYPRFMLQQIQFDGNQSISDDRLEQVTQAYINQPVSRVDLENIRQQLIQYYRRSGFLYPSVLLPSQHITQGKVRYQINEGHLSTIRIQGSQGLDEAYIRDRISLDNEPLQQQKLLDRFQLLLSDPLIERINGVLKPGAYPGESILDLDITRAKPYELTLGLDNYTTPSVGAYTGRLNGIVRNLTGRGDFLQLDLAGSAGLQGISSYFSIPFNRYGTRLNLGFQGSQAKIVDSNLDANDIKNNFTDLNIAISQTVLTTSKRSLSLELQYAYRQTRTTGLGFYIPLDSGAEPNGKAKVSVLRFIQNFSDRNQNRVLSLRSSLNAGFDVLNATINPDPIPDTRFFSWQGQLRYLRKLNDTGTQVFFRSDIQLTTDRLLSQERFALGGVNTVRGYRQNELVRDKGYALAIELRQPLIQAGTQNGHELNIVPFFDFGQAWNLNRKATTLYSAGIGLKWSWQQLSAHFYWAQALNSPPSTKQEYDAQDAGIYFQLQSKIF